MFVRRFPVIVESYVWDAYLELETLGKLTLLNPGESLTFDETWGASLRSIA